MNLKELREKIEKLKEDLESTDKGTLRCLHENNENTRQNKPHHKDLYRRSVPVSLFYEQAYRTSCS